jgi:hypothetical protein
MNRKLKDGEYTKLLRETVGGSRLDAILKAYEGIKEVEKRLSRLPLYRGRKVETGNGKTRQIGKGLPKQVGPLYAQLVESLCGLQKAEYLSEKEVKRAESIVSKAILNKSLSRKRGDLPFTYLVYLLHTNLYSILWDRYDRDRHDFRKQYAIVAGFIREQELRAEQSLTYVALSKRCGRTSETGAWYEKARAAFPDISLPPWENLLFRAPYANVTARKKKHDRKHTDFL